MYIWRVCGCRGPARAAGEKRWLDDMLVWWAVVLGYEDVAWVGPVAGSRGERLWKVSGGMGFNGAGGPF